VSESAATSKQNESGIRESRGSGLGSKRLRVKLLFALILLFLLPIKDTLPGSAQVEYSHAWRLFQQGYLAKSQGEAELAYKQFRISDPRWAAKFQLLEAESMLYRGMYDDSLRVLVTYRDYGSQEGALQKLAIEVFALIHQEQLSTASQKLVQAEAVCGSTDLGACGEVLSARAILELKYSQFDEARKAFLNVLSFAGNHGDSWLKANTTLNLGYIALQVDHYDEAVDWSRSAYQSAIAFGYENIAQGAAGNLGWAYYQLGDDERALEQFVQAEKGAERLGNIRYELKWLSTAGYVYRDSLDLERATEAYRQALYLARQIDSKEDIVNALEDLAQLSVLNGRLEDASAYIARVTPLEGAGGSQLSANLLLTEGMLAAAKRQDSKAESDFRAIQDDSASPVTIRLSAGYELAKLSELQGNSKAAERMYKATLAAYELARATLKNEETKLPFGANATRIYDSYIHLLMLQGRTETALATADQSRARTLEQGLDVTRGSGISGAAILSPRQIAQKANANLLFYWLGEKQSYLWAITPAGIAAFNLPARQQIASIVESYRKVILDLRDPLGTSNANGQSLYKMLVAPAANLIHPAAPVIILADGELSQLNFETLLVPGPEPVVQQGSSGGSQVHYLIEDMTLVSAPSLAMLAESAPIRDRGPSLLLLGNPVSPNDNFPSLPLFGFEMTRIEGHFGEEQISVFTGQKATPSTYLSSNPSRYSYIHFVSHAIASRTNPLDSAIVLSKSNTDENSFKLYARDIIKQPINARLVTISACYGSGMRSYAGEGLVGLSWAFLRAGAQRVIGALWEVSDTSTPSMMDTLYRCLQDGNSPATSLRKAKLSLLHSQSRFSLPFYWATFQMFERR
jgi:CHAT domain-containing protein